MMCKLMCKPYINRQDTHRQRQREEHYVPDVRVHLQRTIVLFMGFFKSSILISSVDLPQSYGSESQTIRQTMCDVGNDAMGCLVEIAF